MADLALEWNSDLAISDTGDFLLVTNTDEVTQRVVRRFLTNAATIDTTSGVATRTPDYLFDGTYGGNARAFVDAVVNSELISRIQYALLDQLAQEPAIDTTRSNVQVTKNVNGISLNAQIAVNTGLLIALPTVEITP